MTNDTADQTLQEADRRVERAKASLLSRVELLKHKLTDARHRYDVPAQITRNPLPAVGIALVLGAAVGLRRTHKLLPAPAGRSVSRAAVTAFAAVALQIVREVALARLGVVARQWWTEIASGSQAPDDGQNDGQNDGQSDGQRAAELEPFAEQ